MAELKAYNKKTTEWIFTELREKILFTNKNMVKFANFIPIMITELHMSEMSAFDIIIADKNRYLWPEIFYFNTHPHHTLILDQLIVIIQKAHDKFSNRYIELLCADANSHKHLSKKRRPTFIDQTVSQNKRQRVNKYPCYKSPNPLEQFQTNQLRRVQKSQIYGKQQKIMTCCCTIHFLLLQHDRITATMKNINDLAFQSYVGLLSRSELTKENDNLWDSPTVNILPKDFIPPCITNIVLLYLGPVIESFDQKLCNHCHTLFPTKLTIYTISDKKKNGMF